MSTEVVGFVGFSRHRPSFTLETVLNLQSRSSEVFPMAVASSVLDLIGSTPMIDVSELSPNPNVRILGKAEFLNPAGSVKDRPALSMFLDAERSGRIKPGDTVIEATSGNTGIALAMVAAVKG